MGLDLLHVVVVASRTFIMMQQRTRAICNNKLILIFACLENIQRANMIARMRNSIISLDKVKTVQIEVIIMRPNFQVNVTEQFI